MKRAYSGSVSTFFNTKFLKQEKEKFIFEVTFPSETLNPFGFVQGGMITSALDEVTSITVNLISEDKKLPNSIDLHTSFHRPVKLGKVIIETKIENKKLIGTNFDGLGFVKGLRDKYLIVENKDFAIFGIDNFFLPYTLKVFLLLNNFQNLNCKN